VGVRREEEDEEALRDEEAVGGGIVEGKVWKREPMVM